MGLNQTRSNGSEWGKWDLHIHTPASYDWDTKCTCCAEEIVTKALDEKLSVIAITDHHTVKGIDDIVSAAIDKNITVLKGIELRTDKGNRGIHIIGLFDNTIVTKTIYDKLLCPLNLSEDDIKTKGEKGIYCNFETACKKIHELGGLVMLHAGTKSNSIEQLDSDIRTTLKKDLASLVDIFEVANQKQVDGYRSIVFPIIKQEFPCIVTSDSMDRSTLQYNNGHSIDAIGKKYSWIKADPTFEGLKQIIYEPLIRISLEDRKPLYLYPKIISARFHSCQEYQSKKSLFPPITFNQEILFSPNLSTIVGPRASGKTVLAEMIGYVADSNSVDKKDNPLIDFLRVEFPDLEIEVVYQSGEEEPVRITRTISGCNDPFYVSPINVEYWSQGEIEKRANNPKKIAAYIGNRLHSELLNKAKEEILSLNREMEALRNSYSDKLLKEIERRRLEAERGQIEAYFTKLRTREYRAITEEIKKNRNKLQLIEGLIRDIEDQIEVIKRVSEQLNISVSLDKDGVLDLFRSNGSLKEGIIEFYELKETHFDSTIRKLEKTVSEIKESNINIELIKKNSELTIQFSEYCRANGVTITKGEVEKRNNRIKIIEQNIVQLNRQLLQYEADKRRHYQLTDELRKKMQIWNEENQRLIDEFNDSFKETKISAVWNNPNLEIAKWIKDQFLHSNDKLRGIVENNYKNKSPIREDYVREVVNELVGDDVGESARDKIISILSNKEKPEFSYSAGKTETIRWYFEDPNTEIIREDLIMRINEFAEIGDTFIKYGSKVLGKDSMSFGERCGTLIELILLSGDHPLIIDQPEDHLDARYVADKVVTMLRENKANRQVLICTHNANIVVLGDSEQVIALSVDEKFDARVQQGTLENERTRKSIYDVLEGGEAAFKKREKKYRMN